MREIEFKNRKYILTNEKHGAITTKHQYRHGLCSYAHLFEDGKIKRLDKQIGTIKDIKFGKKIKDIIPEDDAFENILNGFRGLL